MAILYISIYWTYVVHNLDIYLCFLKVKVSKSVTAPPNKNVYCSKPKFGLFTRTQPQQHLTRFPRPIHIYFSITKQGLHFPFTQTRDAGALVQCVNLCWTIKSLLERKNVFKNRHIPYQCIWLSKRFCRAVRYCIWFNFQFWQVWNIFWSILVTAYPSASVWVTGKVAIIGHTEKCILIRT